MTDRELLESAAKAAGQERSAAGDLWSNARGLPWAPLTDDGDALRLAVRLRIDIMTHRANGHRPEAVEASGNTGAEIEPWAMEARDTGDPYAATRRAIVRAAAAMAQESKTC